MKTQIKATNIKLTSNISNHLDKKLAALEKLIDPKDTSVLCSVEVEKTSERHKRGELFRSEIKLHIAGATFYAEATEENLFDAIDETKAQMTKEITRYKDKKSKSVRKGGAKMKAILRNE